ncbi:MAG: hypothetical protein CMM23_14380 [Rhodospirillaceae bacterium]|nr:hypothetical protein [Rhodospirillaceae bacterium]
MPPRRLSRSSRTLLYIIAVFLEITFTQEEDRDEELFRFSQHNLNQYKMKTPQRTKNAAP